MNITVIDFSDNKKENMSYNQQFLNNKQNDNILWFIQLINIWWLILFVINGIKAKMENNLDINVFQTVILCVVGGWG